MERELTASEIEAEVQGWLKENTLPLRNYSRGNAGWAYFLKHRFEEDTGIYLTSGEFAAMMFLYGYEGKCIKPCEDSPSLADYKFKATLTEWRRRLYEKRFL